MNTMVATYELSHGWLRVGPVRIGKQAFLGNSGMAAPGRSVPKRGLVGVLSSAPRKAKKGSSWLGSPPMPLRRTVETADAGRTFAPPLRLKVARAAIELCPDRAGDVRRRARGPRARRARPGVGGPPAGGPPRSPPGRCCWPPRSLPR